MSHWQTQVKDFHRLFDIEIGTYPAIRSPKLRAELIREEAEETIKAINEGKLLDAIDGLCDLIYVALGTAVTFGVDLDPHFREVHRANMSKIGGSKREDGKWIKPANWQPPNHSQYLE